MTGSEFMNLSIKDKKGPWNLNFRAFFMLEAGGLKLEVIFMFLELLIFIYNFTLILLSSVILNVT